MSENAGPGKMLTRGMFQELIHTMWHARTGDFEFKPGPSGDSEGEPLRAIYKYLTKSGGFMKGRYQSARDNVKDFASDASGFLQGSPTEQEWERARDAIHNARDCARVMGDSIEAIATRSVYYLDSHKQMLDELVPIGRKIRVLFDGVYDSAHGDVEISDQHADRLRSHIDAALHQLEELNGEVWERNEGFENDHTHFRFIKSEFTSAPWDSVVDTEWPEELRESFYRGCDQAEIKANDIRNLLPDGGAYNQELWHTLLDKVDNLLHHMEGPKWDSEPGGMNYFVNRLRYLSINKRWNGWDSFNKTKEAYREFGRAIQRWHAVLTILQPGYRAERYQELKDAVTAAWDGMSDMRSARDKLALARPVFIHEDYR